MTSRPPGPPGGRGVPPRRPARFTQFVHRHGWRAYALPVLVVLTVVVLASLVTDRHGAATSAGPAGSTRPAPSSPPTAEASGRLKVDSTDGRVEQLPADALPSGAAYTAQGTGTFRVLTGASTVIGTGPRRTFAIEVENGVTGVDLDAFARTVMTVLGDRRSWTGAGSVSLQRVNSDTDADFRVSLTSSYTVRTLCGYDQKIETSCYEDDHGPPRVNLNNARWVRGDVQFGQDLDVYRVYMINHEVGHALGHAHSFRCILGGLAPVMMQQTITLREDEGRGSRICRPNVWPYPPGVPASQAVTS